MPHYFKRTYTEDIGENWNFPKDFLPDAVIIKLGGNDYEFDYYMYPS